MDDYTNTKTMIYTFLGVFVGAPTMLFVIVVIMALLDSLGAHIAILGVVTLIYCVLVSMLYFRLIDMCGNGRTISGDFKYQIHSVLKLFLFEYSVDSSDSVGTHKRWCKQNLNSSFVYFDSVYYFYNSDNIVAFKLWVQSK